VSGGQPAGNSWIAIAKSARQRNKHGRGGIAHRCARMQVVNEARSGGVVLERRIVSRDEVEEKMLDSARKWGI
jgi:hypothetical protein